MAHRILHDHEGDGRSVLGMLEVQVERDPKTGVTVVRSVTPVSAPDGAPKATPIFDDGRKSIHAVGGTPGQPTSEELLQVLSVADGFGMKVLLDEVAASPHEAQMKSGDVESSRVLVERVETAPLKETHKQINMDRKSHVEAKQKEARSVGYEDNQTAAVVIDSEMKLNSQNLQENPVTLLFLGYADDTEDLSQEDQGGMITVERVMITEDGEETLLTSAQPACRQEVEQEGDTETPVQTPQVQTPQVQTPQVQTPQVQTPQVQTPQVQTPQVQTPADAAEDETGAGINPPLKDKEADKGKQKTCKCCSVM